MPLHLDYRPKTFSKFVGNKDIVKSMKSILDREDDRPHAWLFHGPSGCGKTTLARIVSEKLGCPTVTKDGSNNRDFQEINSSNNRGIDTAREILRTMVFSPIGQDSKCRVYLLDECHQGTKDFQNSMLKALEDTPKHVYFLLCTTEPEKLLKTIRNRCTQFAVKTLGDKDIEALVTKVVDDEGMLDDMPKEAIEKIVEASEGCPRQALVSLDQIIDLPSDEMEEAVRNIDESKRKTIELCRSLLNGTWTDVREILKGLDDNPERVRQAVNHYMQAVLLNSKGKSPNKRAFDIFLCFQETFFYNGKPGLVRACAEVFCD